MTATAKQDVEPVEKAYDRLMGQVRTACGEDLCNELYSIIEVMLFEREAEAIKHQGEVIMAAIRGDLVSWPGCSPQWLNEPEDR